jgi:hypothetical protein
MFYGTLLGMELKLGEKGVRPKNDNQTEFAQKRKNADLKNLLHIVEKQNP